ncbi:helix-turn-helix domain-containing protein [Bacteroides fluxus]|jgi:ribosome-binding protein aMBF1 (putative translation factor)|uniref:helix-turn-helix domain-containing protein n=1 Tax=Bacteroides fluxus TaxID=626930 RepID=UPI0023A7BE35|nr:helix-turn-helix transcriptional regulator [Bacteroides fluxus]
MGATIDFLKKHESISPSHFEENAKWRKENKTWLEWSRNIALSLVEYMESNGLNRNGLAERLGVSPQYVSKILSGKVNFSFKSIAELEQKLGIKLLDVLELA